jgi:EAL domain-containing protein (putative c-di-GMP-specific phosphodiesterase class I)
VFSAEALVRWNHPTRGLLGPDEFVGLAEQTGLIGELTAYVLEAAIPQAAAWQEAGMPIAVSVNLSARNLRDARLPSFVAGLLGQHGLRPRRLLLEITESALMFDPDQALSTVHALRSLGLGVAVDDYGTGYSSLAYLRQLPLHELKIDRSFVRDVTVEPGDLSIVRSTITLAHELGLRVVAEGVEDAATLELLADLGCDMAQGFHLSRPVPADEFTAWVAASQWSPLRPRAAMPS